MKTNLKDNIFIFGVKTPSDFYKNYSEYPEITGKIIYTCKTSEISEDLACKCVETLPDAVAVDEIDDYPIYEDWSHIYEDYSETNSWGCDYSGIKYYGVKTAKESILSACKEDYCIIYNNQ